MTDGAQEPGSGGAREPEGVGGAGAAGAKSAAAGRRHAEGSGMDPSSGEGSGDSDPADVLADHGAYARATPEQMLGDVRTIRRQARRARHAYWFPLVLFGLLTCASVPFYLQRFPSGRGIHVGPIPVGSGSRPSTVRGVHSGRVAAATFLHSGYLGGLRPVTGVGNAYYWLAAILLGLAATAVWYRLRGDRVGLRTASRGFVVTGLVLLVLALLIPVLAARAGAGPLRILMPGDLLVRGTFPFVLLGVGLCVLAWAERSIALAVIAAGYLALSLVASLYDIENVFYDLGWNISPDNSGLPNVLLPALVLLLSGAGAWVVQHRWLARPTGPADAESAATAEQAS
ncbi:MAG TPA: hypothetical protein VGH96_18140 [Streptosporangiaceae bacterium]